MCEYIIYLYYLNFECYKQKVLFSDIVFKQNKWNYCFWWVNAVDDTLLHFCITSLFYIKEFESGKRQQNNVNKK